MSQRELIIQLFETKGRITNTDFVEVFMHFTGRNRVTDEWMKSYWAARGKKIVHFYGKTWKENGWELQDCPVVVEEKSGQLAFA